MSREKAKAERDNIQVMSHEEHMKMHRHGDFRLGSMEVRDYYREEAAKTLGKSYEDVTEEERAEAKRKLMWQAYPKHPM